MDNILNKFGIYDFFGLLLPGMYFFIVLDFLNIPNILGVQYTTSEGIEVISFLLFSYIIGTLIQEIASYVDKKIQLREKSKRSFLDEDSKIWSKEEREEIRKYVRKKFGKNRKENEQIFRQMKICLENKEKMGKADKYDAIYAMSRDLIVCNFFLFIISLVNIHINRDYMYVSILVCFFTLISSYIFWHRALRYADMRVRTIVRQYMKL